MMAKFFPLDFTWWRDPSQAGWALHEEVSPRIARMPHNSLGETGTFAAMAIGYATPFKPARIVRCGGELQPYQPLDLYSKLFQQFEHVNSPALALAFVQKFGPLSNDGRNPRQGDCVTDILAHATQMRSVLTAYAEGSRALASILGPKGLPLGEGPVGDLQPRLIFAEGEPPLLQFTPKHLLSALWLQLTQYLEGKPKLKRCLECSERFECGPGADRRGDATFCNEQHKRDFHSKKRTRRPGSVLGTTILS